MCCWSEHWYQIILSGLSLKPYLPLVLKGKFLIKSIFEPWPMWLGWLEHCPINRKVTGLIPWSGHIPGLWVQSLVGACMGGNEWIHVSPSFPPSLPLWKQWKKNVLRFKKRIFNIKVTAMVYGCLYLLCLAIESTHGCSWKDCGMSEMLMFQTFVLFTVPVLSDAES